MHDKEPDFLARPERAERPKYAGIKPLGEHEPALAGITLEYGSANANELRLNFGGADQEIAQKLRGEMQKSGQFYQGGMEGVDEYLFIKQEGGVDSPYEAIVQIAKSEDIQQILRKKEEQKKLLADERSRKNQQELEGARAELGKQFS